MSVVVLVVLFLVLVGNLKEKMCLWLFFLCWLACVCCLVIQKKNVSVVVLLVLIVLVVLLVLVLVVLLVLVSNPKEKMCLWLSFLSSLSLC